MLRKIVLIVFLFACIINLHAQPAITFDKTTQHLGFVHQGDTLHFEYTFTNSGTEPLVISDTKVECGCTTVEKPEEPVAPHKQGVIKVTFTTNSAIDRQDRTVIVISNVPGPPAILRFKCIVLKAKKKS
ncbi:MAG TPA: DUF1573 domain-containing protein [Bacteroidia bacterium]|jgi:hypothetical protein|nr:DUF1573 domain-containing protein [Bacteroidia bacterium]